VPERNSGYALILAGLAGITGCGGSSAQDLPFQLQRVADFDDPWAMAFLPDGRLLVTEKAGSLRLVDLEHGGTVEISGVPDVAYRGQGGLGDVVLHPDYADNGKVYLSFSEPDARAAVARATLVLEGEGGELADLEVIWRQSVEIPRRGHFGQRIAFGGGYLWISSGERQQGAPAQDMSVNLGKIVRLNDDGSVPQDNPFFDRGGVTAQIWSLGHRNPLGLAFDPQGQLWNVEMGPQGGDELNRIERGANYGWPIVSNGVNYGGGPIPDHDTRTDMVAPAVYWLRDTAGGQSLSPSSLMFYTGSAFPRWRGNAFVGGLAGRFISRIEVNAGQAREVERFNMGMRIRGLAQGPGGAIWVLEDGSRGGNGRLYKLSPPD